MEDVDLGISSGADTPTTGHHGHHGHHHHPHLPAGRRLKHFFRPDGRKVHVAHSPEELDHHRRRQSSVAAEKGGEDYDVVMHGSAEHVEALREAHSHHCDAREQMREKHGDAYSEFERIHMTLETLNQEIHDLSEKAVQLDASFSKYGYSAHLRTKDSPNASSANSLIDYNSDHESELERSKAAKHQGETMSFFKAPVVRQYFHKGLLWRAQETTEVASYELFVDLFYVGIIAISGDGAAEEPNGESLLRFAVTFIMSWKFWNEISTAIAWFDADDCIRRVTVLFILVCLLGLTTNIAASFDTTWTPLVAFYIAGRWFSAIYYLWMAYLIPMVRGAMIGTALHCFVPGLLWIGTIYLHEPGREGLVWPALFLDVFGGMFIAIMFRPGPVFPKKYRKWAEEHLQFFPGANIEHKIERTGAFTTLVFGYSVVGLLYQSSVAFGINGFFGKAVLGLIQAFSFNWIYFEVDSFNLHTHAIRRHKISALIWMFIHLPAAMAFVLAGAALSRLVLAHDTSGANPDDLLEPYRSRSEEEISDGLRWYYCAGLSITLICVGVISLTHIHKDIPNQRLTKYPRLVFRFAVAIVILLLPLTHNLNSLELIATTTCLTVIVLAVDIYGSSCTFDSLTARKRHCTYSARCKLSKKHLLSSHREGKVINVEELGKAGHAEHGVDSTLF